MVLGKKDKDNTTETAAEKTSEEKVDRAPRASRSSDRRKFDRDSYRRPHDLSFPPELKEAIEAEGDYLYWVAVVDPKTKQFTNARVNHFLSLGGALVTAKDIKDIDPTFLSGLTKYAYREEWADEDDTRGDVEAIRKEHLVLMRIPLEYSEFKTEENRKLVSDQLATAQQEYKRNDDAFVKDFKHGSTNLKLKGEFFSD